MTRMVAHYRGIHWTVSMASTTQCSSEIVRQCLQVLNPTSCDKNCTLGSRTNSKEGTRWAIQYIRYYWELILKHKNIKLKLTLTLTLTLTDTGGTVLTLILTEVYAQHGNTTKTVTYSYYKKSFVGLAGRGGPARRSKLPIVLFAK